MFEEQKTEETEEQETQKPQNKWSKYFPKINEEDYRYDIRVQLGKLSNQGRIPSGWDMDQVVDFIYWFSQHENETSIRYTGMSPHSFFLQLLSCQSGY